MGSWLRLLILVEFLVVDSDPNASRLFRDDHQRARRKAKNTIAAALFRRHVFDPPTLPGDMAVLFRDLFMSLMDRPPSFPFLLGVL